MKRIKTQSILLILTIALFSNSGSNASCRVTSTTRIWDTLSSTDSILLALSTTISQIQTTVTNDFLTTFTTIDALNNSYSSILSQAEVMLSTVDTISNDIMVTQTMINTINAMVNAVSQDINVIQTDDFSGTFSVIQAINTNVTSQFSTLSSSIHNINVILNVISGSQLSIFLANTISIESISSVVMANLELIQQISETAASNFDNITTALDILLETNTSLVSNISQAEIAVEQDFAGTWTMLAQLTTLVTAVDATASIIDTLFLSVDVGLINAQLETVNSAIDFITQQLNTSNATLITITSFITPLSTHLDTINSSVDSLSSLLTTIGSQTSSLVNQIATVNSLCDVTIELESTLGMQFSELDANVILAMSGYSSINSLIDIVAINVSDVTSLAAALDSSIVEGLSTVVSGQNTIESVINTLFTISSTLDSFNTLQSYVGVLNANITSDLAIANTILSKTDALYLSEFTLASSINTIASEISVIDVQISTITSRVNILASVIPALQATIVDTTLPLTNTISSKVIFAESNVGAIDLNVQQIQKDVNTISSNLTLLNTDFQQTWTIINAIQKTANSLNNLLLTTQSAVNVLASAPITVDASGTYTALATTQLLATSIQSVLTLMNKAIPDVVGTFTALAQMEAYSSDMVTQLANIQSTLLSYNFQVCIGSSITTANIGTTGYTINSGGNYYIVSTINFAPTTATSIITINASNVVLDMAGKVFQQSNTTASVNGIFIASGVSNVTITNGLMVGLTGDQITTGTGVSAILIENLSLATAGKHSIDMSATSSNVVINEINIFQSGSDAIRIGQGSDITIKNVYCTLSGGDGISMNPSAGVLNRVIVRDCEFFATSGNGIGIYGNGLQDEISIDNCVMMHGSSSGIVATNVTRSTFVNNLVEANEDNGVSLVGAVSAVEISDNIIHRNTGAGIYVQNSTAQACSFLRNVLGLNGTNYLEGINSGAHSILANHALAATDASNYSIGGGAKSTAINKAIISQKVGTFSVYPGKWRNISETTS